MYDVRKPEFCSPAYHRIGSLSSPSSSRTAPGPVQNDLDQHTDGTCELRRTRDGLCGEGTTPSATLPRHQEMAVCVDEFGLCARVTHL